MSGRLHAAERDPRAARALLSDIEEMTREHARRFDALTETGQMLYLHFQELSIAYGVYDRAGKPREEVARDYLLRRFGPKFTERVFGSPDLKAMLQLDAAPRDAGDMPGTI